MTLAYALTLSEGPVNREEFRNSIVLSNKLIFYLFFEFLAAGTSPSYNPYIVTCSSGYDFYFSVAGTEGTERCLCRGPACSFHI